MSYYRDQTGRLWRGPYRLSGGKSYWSRLERHGVWYAMACEIGEDWSPESAAIVEQWHPQWGVEIEPVHAPRQLELFL